MRRLLGLVSLIGLGLLLGFVVGLMWPTQRAIDLRRARRASRLARCAESSDGDRQALCDGVLKGRVDQSACIGLVGQVSQLHSHRRHTSQSEQVPSYEGGYGSRAGRSVRRPPPGRDRRGSVRPENGLHHAGPP